MAHMRGEEHEAEAGREDEEGKSQGVHLDKRMCVQQIRRSSSEIPCACRCPMGGLGILMNSRKWNQRTIAIQTSEEAAAGANLIVASKVHDRTKSIEILSHPKCPCQSLRVPKRHPRSLHHCL